MNKHLGSSLDEFLEEEGILEDAEAVAIKRVVAFLLQQEMKKQSLTKIALAKRLHTSRSALDRLLDPNNISMTLQTLTRIAHIVGKRVNISFESIS